MDKAKKIIQIPIDDDLLERKVAGAAMVAEKSRDLHTQACQQRLKRLHCKKLDRAHTRGYKRIPENKDWAESSSKLLATRLAIE